MVWAFCFDFFAMRAVKSVVYSHSHFCGRTPCGFPVKCYVLSTLLIAALLAILKWVSVSLLAAWILILAASAVLLWLAPVETENNPLDETEVRVYRRRTRIVLGIELLAALLATLLHRNFLVTIIGFGLLTASFMLVVGACANLKQHWKRCV